MFIFGNNFMITSGSFSPLRSIGEGCGTRHFCPTKIPKVILKVVSKVIQKSGHHTYHTSGFVAPFKDIDLYFFKRKDIVLFFLMRKNHRFLSVFFAEASMATESEFSQASAKEN